MTYVSSILTRLFTHGISSLAFQQTLLLPHHSSDTTCVHHVVSFLVLPPDFHVHYLDFLVRHFNKHISGHAIHSCTTCVHHVLSKNSGTCNKIIQKGINGDKTPLFRNTRPEQITKRRSEMSNLLIHCMEESAKKQKVDCKPGGDGKMS